MTSPASPPVALLAPVLLGLAACGAEPTPPEQPSELSATLSAALAAFEPDSVGPGERADAHLAMTQPHYAGVWFDTASKSIVIGMTAGGIVSPWSGIITDMSVYYKWP